MASSSVLVLFFVFAAVLIDVAGTTSVYNVGDREGWKIPEKDQIDFYQQWASKINFFVGDSIMFEYRNDSVVKVEKTVYYHCNESGSDPVFTDGKTLLLLDRPGFYYFVSSDSEHCKKGMRLMIEVMNSGAAPSPLPNSSNIVSGTVSLIGSVMAVGTFIAMAFSSHCILTWNEDLLIL